MPLEQSILYNVPTLVLGMSFVLIAIAFSVSGLILSRLFIPVHKLKLHNDIAGFIFTTLGVTYAVLLAFAVIVVWQDFDRTNINVSNESNYLADLYRDSEGFDKSFRDKSRAAIDEYAKAIVVEEWPLLAKGERSDHVQTLSTKVWKLYAGYKPKTITEQIFFKEALSKKNAEGELRRQRIMDSRTGLHPVLWFVLIFGGITTIAFTFFFGTENFGAQIIMTSMLATLIALILFTIMVLDYPFTGSVRILPEAFIANLQCLSNIK